MIELVTIIRDEDGELAAVEVDLSSILLFIALLMCIAWLLR